MCSLAQSTKHLNCTSERKCYSARTVINLPPEKVSKPSRAPEQGRDTMWKTLLSLNCTRRRTESETLLARNKIPVATLPSSSLSETCGLSISELEAMAARQARQLETQEQLLAAKAQRLRFLKSGGEAERLQRLREKVASQEERLRKLRALRGKVQSNRNANSVLSSDLESLRAVFNEKEKELSLAVAKVEELTRQLEDLRKSNKDQLPNGQQSAAAAELEKLRRELMYRQKLREAQATRVAAQRAALNQRQEETMRVDRRIAELQERLHRKRLLNQQLAVTLKHQENTDDFVSVPNKNDPKYQTLPYNAKLFAPFANKHEQDQFEKSMQQMQIIQADHHHHNSQLSSHQHDQIHQNYHGHHHHQQTQQQQQFQQQPNQINTTSSSTNNYHNNYNSNCSNPSGTTEESSSNNTINNIQSLDPQTNNGSNNSTNNKGNANLINNSSAATISSLQQLHHLLSISGLHQQNGRSANQQQSSSSSSSYGNSGSANTNTNSNSNVPSSVSTTMATTSGVPNGLQTVHSTQANNNVSRGKALPIIGNGGESNSNNGGGIPLAFPVIRPSNFYPTGAPPSSSTASNSSSSSASTATSSNIITSNNGGIINSGLSSVPSGPMMPLVASARHNGLLSSQNTTCNSNGNSLEISLTGTNTASLSSTGSNDTGFVSSGSSCSNSGMTISSQSRQQQQQQQQQQHLQQQLKPALPPKPAKPTPPPRQAHDMFTFNMRSGSADMVLLDRSELPIKSKPLFVKSGSAQPNSGNMVGGQAISSEKDSVSNNNSNSTVRVSINRRIEMPPAFLFPESDPPPSDLVPEHQQSSMMNSGFSAGQHQSNSEGFQNSDSQQHPQQQHQQLLQLSPVSSASGDSVDASPLLMPKGSGMSHQLVPEEYTLPDLFPPHPANNQNVFSSPSASSIHMTSSGSNKGDHFMNMNNKINSHMHRNAQALIESLGQQASETSQRTNMQVHHQQHHAAVDENMINCEKGKRIDHNANSGNVTSSQVADNLKATSNSRESMGLPHAGIQLESNEAVNEHDSESCGSNINNNMIAERGGSSNGNSSTVVGMDSRDHIPSEVETVTANKGEGNINNNPPGIGIAPAATTVPGVLRRVKKSNFKSNNKDHMPIGRRVSFDPLALLLDASLEGELDLVVKTAGEVGNVSAANDEGITALHNAICAGHFDVVRFLVQFGCDVNAQDSDGWTPLHCAASCNNVSMVKFLVEHGACIFATTLSDHETAAEKCEEDEDGFGPCSEYLYSIQEKLGIMNGGVVYAVFDYDAQNPDELSFREGERQVILRKGDEYEREWWWASLTEKEGYVPRNLLGLYPRVMPQKRGDS
ncbi:unnamed protein product [Orchesella dallaii]|uniref:SH3 domain-containing protein n=1 Tax=Orchesella dallaii TaxID=48710 RepID=A0ABP1QHJ9_9HEXA